jgi:hypothetical protein
MHKNVEELTTDKVERRDLDQEPQSVLNGKVIRLERCKE